MKFFEGKLEEFRLSDLFKDIETDDIYENTEDFASYKSVESKANVKLKNGSVFEHESRIVSMQHIYDDYNRSANGINDTVQEISIMDDGRISVKLNIDELSTKDFLKEPLDTFNEHSKSKKYNDLFSMGRDSYLDVKDMLIDEGVIDKNRYDELLEEKLEEKREFDKNEEIARENSYKLMEDEEFVNSIMDSDDKYISKQVYFVNKNEFSTMDFIDDGFDDTYIKFSDGEKVLVGPNSNNTEEDLAKFTAQAKLYGEFSRNDKYKDYKVNLDSDYGVRLSDMTKPYSDLVLIRPDDYNKDTGNFDMRFKDIVDLDVMKKNINNTKMTGNINKNQELFRQALGMDTVNNTTSNVRYIDGDFDSDVIYDYDRPQGVSHMITEEDFVDVMNELNASINKENDNEIKL